MPVSVACESSANVNAALRESLGGGYAAAASVGDDTKAVVASSSVNGNGNGDVDSFQDQLVASAKRVLLTKVDYEESNSFGKTVLDSLKSKYFLLKANSTMMTATNGTENGHNGNSNGNNSSSSNGNIPNGDSGGGSHSNSNTNSNNNNNNNNMNNNNHRKNSHQLPQPQCVLYPRENICVGWKGTNRKWVVGAGMTNVGNTCYLNSTLQALFHVPAIANWLMTDTQHAELCDGIESGCIVCAMMKTLQTSQTGQGAIRPYCIYSKLKSICKHLVMGRQEDAHEFLRYLVETMERQYLMRYRNFKELDQYSKETTPINHILGGYVKTAVNCLTCNNVSVTFQHFQDILLDIRKSDSIDDALDGYFSRERLEDMSYKCEACMTRKVSATKQFSLERAPIVLCLQLKRFSMLGTKMNKHITIKPTLDLSRFSSDPEHAGNLTYRLVAMITHLGASQHCGHYTAIGLTESGMYYNFDDSYVHPISIQTVTNTNAYVIFYERESLPKPNGNALKYAAESKENHAESFVGAGAANHNESSQPSRMIGPQLPLGGLTNAAAKNLSYTNGGPATKLSVNRHNGIPTGTSNSKFVFKFKNETDTSGASKSGAAMGTGKFQELPHPQSPLVGPSNKAHTANGRSHNHNNLDEDKLAAVSGTSSKATTKKTTLPSMPKLFDMSPLAPLAAPSAAGPKKTLTLVPKSLVPYESASDDDDSVADVADVTRSLPNSANNGATQADAKPIVLSRATSSDSDINGRVIKSTVKRSASATPCSNGRSDTDTDSDMPTKTPGKPIVISQVIGSIFGSSVANRKQLLAAAAGGSHSDDSLPARSSGVGGIRKPAAPPAKRSLSASPPHVETKTGIWMVTELKKINNTNNNNNQTAANIASATETAPKNVKNPFATKSVNGGAAAATANTSGAKRAKLNGLGESSRAHNGNGYRPEDGNQSVAAELTKQSHRGYGATVLTWNGTQTEIEQENNNNVSLNFINKDEQIPAMVELTVAVAPAGGIHDESMSGNAVGPATTTTTATPPTTTKAEAEATEASDDEHSIKLETLDGTTETTTTTTATTIDEQLQCI